MGEQPALRAHPGARRGEPDRHGPYAELRHEVHEPPLALVRRFDRGGTLKPVAECLVVQRGAEAAAGSLAVPVEDKALAIRGSLHAQATGRRTYRSSSSR